MNKKIKGIGQVQCFVGSNKKGQDNLDCSMTKDSEKKEWIKNLDRVDIEGFGELTKSGMLTFTAPHPHNLTCQIHTGTFSKTAKDKILDCFIEKVNKNV